jgi:hypothetical protein
MTFILSMLSTPLAIGLRHEFCNEPSPKNKRVSDTQTAMPANERFAHLTALYYNSPIPQGMSVAGDTHPPAHQPAATVYTLGGK